MVNQNKLYLAGFENEITMYNFVLGNTLINMEYNLYIYMIK